MSGTSLGTLVTYNPWSVGPTALLDDVAARFEELGIHHVAVVDAERRVIGMLSETDLLRARQSKRMILVGAGGEETNEATPVSAGDVMTRDVASIATTADFHAALDMLLTRRIHALPVVEGGRLVGLVSSRDFIREFSYGELEGTREPISSLLKGKPQEPLQANSTLDEALLAMHELGASCLAVAQGDCPIGVVSQRDIVREKCRLDEQAEYFQEMQHSTPLLKVTRNSPPIRSGQRLCEAAAAMVDHALPAVTVVNQSNRLLGLITEDDLLGVLYDNEA
jgi:CBS domain-containing protein